MKTKRFAVLAIVAFCAAIAFAGWLLNYPAEPSYQGKPISYWLERAYLPQTPHQTPLTVQPTTQPNPIFEAKLAVAAIGPQALPYIAAHTRKAPWPLARLYSWVYNRFPPLVSKRLPVPKLSRSGLSSFLALGYFLAITEQAGTNAIPTLVKLSSDGNPDVRRAAILSLGRVAPLDHDATLPVLERALADPELSIQFNALQTICLMSITEPRVASILMTFLRTRGKASTSETRFEVLAAAMSASALSPLPNADCVAAGAGDEWARAFLALSNWRRTPTDENRQLVWTAFDAAFSSPADGPPLDRALKYFQFSPDEETSVLGPLLSRALRARSQSVRDSAAHLLEDLGPKANVAVPAMDQVLSLVTDSNPENRCAGAQLLGDAGIATSNVLAILQKMMLEDEWLEPRLAAAETIYRLDPKQGPAMIPHVIELIGWTDPGEHSGPARMAELLDRIGEPSGAVLTELTRLLGHQEETVRIAASKALMDLAPARKPECVAVLRDIMTTSNSGSMRFQAAKVLLRVSPEHTSEVVAQIAGLFKMESEFYQRPEAVELLGEIGPAAYTALPQLRVALESPDWNLRRAAARALTMIQTNPPPRAASPIRDN